MSWGQIRAGKSSNNMISVSFNLILKSHDFNNMYGECCSYSLRPLDGADNPHINYYLKQYENAAFKNLANSNYWVMCN